jgi:hypothetical protein
VVKSEEMPTPPAETAFASTMEFEDIGVTGGIMYEDDEF